jgi:hypothetical protein
MISVASRLTKLICGHEVSSSHTVTGQEYPLLTKAVESMSDEFRYKTQLTLNYSPSATYRKTKRKLKILKRSKI